MDSKLLKHGAFSWFELMTKDVEGAKDFYRKLFGWETEEMPIEGMEGMEGMKYTVIKVDGDPVAGLTGMPPECQGMPPAWGVYITVDDVDVTAARVEELGGKLLRPPMDIPKVGRFCVIQDPQGAALCAMTYVKKEGE